MFNRIVILVVLGVLPILSWSQDNIAVRDEKYLEDQIYAGFSYNFIANRPNGVEQRNLSYNLQFGLIKDIPVNRARNFGFGLGVGYAVNSYYSNILATESENGISYRLPDQIDFTRSKLETHAIEIPFEIRWRTSNSVEYKFWRIYAGVKAAYNFSRRSKLVGSGNSNSFSNDDIRQWHYGAMINFGYNTWNLHVYYNLNNLLEDRALLNDQAIEIRPLRVGVIFYIL